MEAWLCCKGDVNVPIPASCGEGRRTGLQIPSNESLATTLWLYIRHYYPQRHATEEKEGMISGRGDIAGICSAWTDPIWLPHRSLHATDTSVTGVWMISMVWPILTAVYWTVNRLWSDMSH